MDAERQGAAAFGRGDAYESNPYTKSDWLLARYWDKGYEQAEAQRAYERELIRG
jgi:hypothetical protein